MSILKKIFDNKNRLKLIGISGVNQAVSSGTNFLINLYLVSKFSALDFGIYGIGFSIIIFIGGIGNAFFLTQMVVIFPSLKEQEKESFIANTLYLILAFCIACYILALLIMICGVIFHFGNEIFNKYILIIAFASTMYLLKEFFVRTSYNNRKEIIAVYIHSSILITAVILFLIENYIFGEVNIFVAFLIYGISHLISVVLGLFLSKLKIESYSLSKSILIFKKMWKNGKWSSLTSIVYTLRSQAHLIIATIFIGPAGVGNLNAARLFITPAVMIIPVISQLALPRLSTLREISHSALLKKGVLLTRLYLLFGIFYSLTLLLVYDGMIDAFFNESYENLYTLTFYWCIYAIMLAFRNGKDIIAQVLQQFKKLTVFNLISSIITLFGCYILVLFFGLVGNILGLILGEIVLIIMLYNLEKSNANDK